MKHNEKTSLKHWTINENDEKTCKHIEESMKTN